MYDQNIDAASRRSFCLAFSAAACHVSSVGTINHGSLIYWSTVEEDQGRGISILPLNGLSGSHWLSGRKGAVRIVGSRGTNLLACEKNRESGNDSPQFCMRKSTGNKDFQLNSSVQSYNNLAENMPRPRNGGKIRLFEIHEAETVSYVMWRGAAFESQPQKCPVKIFRPPPAKSQLNSN